MAFQGAGCNPAGVANPTYPRRDERSTPRGASRAARGELRGDGGGLGPRKPQRVGCLGLARAAPPGAGHTGQPPRVQAV